MVLFLFMIVVKFILKILTSVSDSQKKIRRSRVALTKTVNMLIFALFFLFYILRSSFIDSNNISYLIHLFCILQVRIRTHWKR